MSLRTTPPFRADHVGSLLRPRRLLDARAAREAGRIGADELRMVEDEAILDAIRLQQDVGLEAITDGEFRRKYWHLDFLLGFQNVEQTKSTVAVSFHTRAGDISMVPPGLKVTGRLGRPKGIFVDHFKFLKANVGKGTPKITLPSPSNMHFRGGRKVIDETAYPTLEEFYDDLARVYNLEVKDLIAAGCKYLQIDEVNFAYLCDETLRANVRTSLGEDPDGIAHTYARLINQSIAGRPADLRVTMHLCRGNYRSSWVGEGGYEPVAEVLFNEMNIDGYFLEFDDERSGDFKPLRHLPKGKQVVLGLVTTKLPTLESKDLLKRRIDEASKYCPLDQLCLSPQCGFASTVEGNDISLETEIDKLRLVVEVASEVWG